MYKIISITILIYFRKSRIQQKLFQVPCTASSYTDNLFEMEVFLEAHHGYEDVADTKYIQSLQPFEGSIDI